MTNQTQAISFENPWMAHYHIIPNIADDELSKDEYRLYGHYIRVCQWVNQHECYESTRTTSEKCDISRDNLKIAREGLERKGYIKCEHPSSRVHSIKIRILDVWGRNYGAYAPLPKLVEIFETLVERAKSDKSLMPTLQQLRIVLDDKSSELAEDSSNVVDLSATIGRNIDPKNKVKEKREENREGNLVASQTPAASSTPSSIIGEENTEERSDANHKTSTCSSDPKTRRKLEQVIINNCKKVKGGLLKKHLDLLNETFVVVNDYGEEVEMLSLNDIYDTDEDYPRYVKETFDYYHQYGLVDVGRLINNLREVTRPSTGWLDWKEENTSVSVTEYEDVDPFEPVGPILGRFDNPNVFSHYSDHWLSEFLLIETVNEYGARFYVTCDSFGIPDGDKRFRDLPP